MTPENATSDDSLPRLIRLCQVVFLIGLGVLLILQAIQSLSWRMEHDTPLLHYTGFLMKEHHLMPYRDFFETSLPGSFAFHYWVGMTVGFGDVAFRIVDLVVLGLCLLAAGLFLRRFGALCAIGGALMFGVLYLSKGNQVSLQRDYLGLIPIAFALLCLPHHEETKPGLLHFAALGLLYGLAFWFKPHLVLSLPILLIAMLQHRWDEGEQPIDDFLSCAGASAAAFCVPGLVVLGWLVSNGALGSFLELVLTYLPMHSSLTGAHQNLTGSTHFNYLVFGTLNFGGYGVLFIAALFASQHAFTQLSAAHSPQRHSLIVLFLSLLTYALYPTLAGKFWDYHYIPFAYFCVLTLSLCLFQHQGTKSLDGFQQSIPVLVLVLALTLQLNLSQYVQRVWGQLRVPQVQTPKDGRVDELAGWLKSQLRPGDTVQPLDWTGGSIHAMLLAKAKLATSFLYDYHFYHHVSSAYNKRLRARFLKQMKQKVPRYIVDVFHQKPWVSGHDTSRSFPKLQAFLGRHYRLVFVGRGYRILERHTPKSSQRTPPRQRQPTSAPSSRPSR